MAGKRIIEHLEELRGVIIASLSVAAVTTAVAAVWVKPLVAWIVAGAPSLVFTEIYEPFMCYCKVALGLGVLAAFPVIVEIVRRYLRDALRLPAAVSVIAMVIGVGSLLLTQYVFMPPVCRLFLAVGSGFTPMLRLDAYLSLYASLVLMSIAGLALPVAGWYAVRLFGCTKAMLTHARPYAFVGAFIVGAVITPPDVFSQCIVSSFLYLGYEILIACTR